MKNNDSKLVVVTGATRGLGRAMSQKLIRMGHMVAGCGRSTDGINEMNELNGPNHTFRALDVSNDSSVYDWAREIIGENGAPDVILNNAALANSPAPLWKVPCSEFSEIVDVNIKGVANIIRHFVPAMIKRGSGVIVNFSSGWGRTPSPEVAPYCTTKWAVEGLSKSLAQELPGGLATVAYSPGMIDTDMLRNYFGSGAASHPEPAVWAEEAVPFLLGIGPEHNGQSL